jgi:BirA family biotin operon repressor/biotin-[acetyl-CoA-carboxylase] ligase
MLASRKNELVLGQIKLHLSSVDSTNNYAANMLKEGLLKQGTVILADEQTNGRGQRGSVWQSEAGFNLQMTLVLFPNELKVTHQRYINSFVSVSLVKYLACFGINAKIKWPNDILIDNKKIAGILIENHLKNGMIDSSLVGIGLNVNQLDFAPLQATSLRKEIDLFTPLSEVLDSVLYQLNIFHQKLISNQYVDLQTLYHKNLWGFNKLKKFKDEKGVFFGKITGVSEEGLLNIETENGTNKYNIKEISFLLDE